MQSGQHISSDDDTRRPFGLDLDEGALEVPRLANVTDDDRHTENSTGLRKFLPMFRSWLDAHHDGKPRRRWDGFMENLHVLLVEPWRMRRQSRDVAAWPRQACDKTGVHRIRHECHH